jgi:hypothetical protein
MHRLCLHGLAGAVSVVEVVSCVLEAFLSFTGSRILYLTCFVLIRHERTWQTQSSIQICSAYIPLVVLKHKHLISGE